MAERAATRLSALVALALVGCANASVRAREDGEKEARVEEARVERSEEPLAPERSEPAPLVEPEPSQPGRTPPIENAGALAPFFATLARTEAGEGVTRVTNLGDSSIGADGLPHAMRTLFARDFGDAGPGYLRLQRQSNSDRNRTVSLTAAPSWELCVVIRRCRRDGRYGLGGMTVESRGRARTIIRPEDGRVLSRAELWYLAQPSGGRIGLTLGAQPEVIVETAAAALEDRWHELDIEPGTHRVQVRALGGGPARAFGVVLENEGPGVVWDSLSVVGAFTHRLLAHDEAHFARQLARRAPSLVVLNYGGNDLRRVVWGHVDRPTLEDETHRLLARVRDAVPETACLVIGISDHTRSGGAAVRPEHVQTVIGSQRAAALRAGCAFWDTTLAMGGDGAFPPWQRRGLGAGDGKHLTERGRQIIAARLYAALMHARALA